MAVLHPLPTILTTRVRIPLASAGAYVAVVPGLRNTDAVGVLIDSIVFGCNMISTAQGVQIDLRWHNEQLTAGLVDLLAVAWPWPYPATGATGTVAIKLTRPMYLAPGDFISLGAVSTAGGRAVNDLTVAAIGRQVAAAPHEVWLPYLQDYIGPTYAINSGAAIADQSGAADLGNPFDVPLEIERMIGRVMRADPPPPWFIDTLPSPIWSTFTMRVSDHRDNFWVSRFAPLPIVCNGPDRSWILNHQLEPKGFVRVEFEGVANVADPDGFHDCRAEIGLVGYRRIQP